MSEEAVYYRSEVTGIGREVSMMIDEGVVILFSDPVPPELAEVAVCHSPLGNPLRGIGAGDVIEGFGSEPLIVTGVGSRADENLRTLGHIVLYANPAPDVTLLPGALFVTGPLSVPDRGGSIRLMTAGSA